MSQTTTGSPGPAIGEMHEVRGNFADPDQLQEAVSQLEMSGFDRADLSLPEAAPPPERATPEAGAREVDTEEDARQARTLHTSGAGAVGAMAAAGLVIATGGGAVPAVAAAVVAGGLAGGTAFALSSSANNAERETREWQAATGTLVLEVRAMTAEKRTKAEAILRAAGATGIEVR
jgi:hypothetical protein